MTDELRFAKYEGTGNDFVMVVDLDDERPITAEEAAGSATGGSGSAPTA